MGVRTLLAPVRNTVAPGWILPAKVSCEGELLLLVSRLELSEAERARVLTLAPQADWRRVLTLIRAGRVFPLAQRSLAALHWPHVPVEIVAEFEETWRQIVRWGIHLSGEMFRYLDLFAEQGIQTVPYKGPSLAAELYGDVTMRQSSDLDLLVRSRDVLRAKEVLLKHHFRPEYDLTPRQEQAYLRAGCEYNFDRPNLRLHVEVHWRLLPWFFPLAPAPERLWEGLVQTTIAGRQVPALPPETLALALCLHGYKHMWEHLGLVCDIAALARSGQVNWLKVAQEAERLGAGRVVRMALALANGLLGAPVPEEVYRRGQDPITDQLAADCAERILSGEARPPSELELYRFYLKGIGLRRDQMLFLTRWFLCSTTPQGALQLPGNSALPLQVVTRSAFLGRRLLRRLWH